MRRSGSLLLAGAAFAAAVCANGAAVAADADGWAAANAAFLRGKASAMRPGNRIEIGYCTGYWQALVAANANGTVPAAVIAKIEAEIPDSDISAMFEGWAFMLDGSKEALAASNEAEADAGDFLTRAAAGDFTDALDYFEMLGACQLPPLRP